MGTMDTLVLRGNPNGDPDYDPSNTLSLSGLGIQPIPVPQGEVMQDGNGRPLPRLSRINDYIVKVPSTTVVKAADGAILQDWGAIWYLLTRVLMPPEGSGAQEWYSWIMGWWSDVGTETVVPRARINPATMTTDNDFWGGEISFPIPVVLVGEVTVSPDFATGLETLEFKLQHA